jgi:hypothetical protein
MPSVWQHIVFSGNVLVFCKFLLCCPKLICQCRGIEALPTLHASKKAEIKRYSEEYHHWTKADPQDRAKTKATPASNFVSNKISSTKVGNGFIG